MQFIPSNREDISRYYRNTFIKLKDFGDLLFYVESIDSMRVLGKCEDGEPFCIYMDDDTPYEVEYILPHKSFFQMGEHAVQLQRVPAKQYFRGLCQSNTQMMYMMGGTFKQVGIDFASLKAFVNKQTFMTLRQALNDNTKVTCAMSPRMMFNRNKRELCIDFTPIAKVNPGKLAVTVYKPIFMDEIKECLANSGDLDTFAIDVYVPPAPKEKTKTGDLLKEMGQTINKQTSIKSVYGGKVNIAPVNLAIDAAWAGDVGEGEQE